MPERQTTVIDVPRTAELRPSMRFLSRISMDLVASIESPAEKKL